jgi:hypothetical protein
MTRGMATSKFRWRTGNAHALCYHSAESRESTTKEIGRIEPTEAFRVAAQFSDGSENEYDQKRGPPP